MESQSGSTSRRSVFPAIGAGLNGFVALRVLVVSVCMAFVSSLLAPDMALAQTSSAQPPRMRLLPRYPEAVRDLPKAHRCSHLPRFTVKTARWP